MFGLQTLESRRHCSQMFFLHKLANGQINSTKLLSLLNFHVPSQHTRNSNLFKVPFHRTNYGYNNPISVMQRRYNQISSQVDLFMSFNSFRVKCKELL